MSNNRKLQLIVVVALALCLLAGCGAKATKTAEPAEATPTEEEIFGAAPEETPGLGLATPYIQLFYPEEWEGLVTISQQDHDKSHAVSFSVNLSGEDTELFTILLSPTEHDGFLLGQLKDKTAGDINVYTFMNEYVDGLSEADYEQFCTLQERVNDFIIQFHQDERFSPAK